MLDESILELFREEAREHLAALESLLLELESSDEPASNRMTIDKVFRHAHSIKGSARAMGLPDVQSAGQTLEDTLDDLRENPETANRETIGVALARFDALRDSYEQWEAGNAATVAQTSQSSTSESTPNAEASPAAQSTPIVDEEIMALFREESREHVDALERLLLDLETTEDPTERRSIIDNVFRHAHTVKGSARAIGLMELQDLAQVLEDTLDGMRSDPANVSRSTIEQSISQFDALHKAYGVWVRDDPANTDADPANDTPAVAAASSKASAETAKGSKPATTKTHSAKSSEDRSVVRVAAARLDRMLSLAGEVRVSQRGGDALESQLEVLNEQATLAMTDFKRLEQKWPRADNSREAGELKDDLEQLHDQIESTVERLRQLQSDFGKKRFREELLVEALEQDVRTARLVPLSNLTDSMRRAVRDLVKSLGKSIRYEPDVGNILLDKAVMESLKDPLMHMIRNGADHGIEMPEARAAAGKPAEGTISITASRRAESVQVRICDDGGGINFDRIRQKLKQENGLNDSEVAAYSPKELARILFQAGFSTKQKATEVSGRGVGMDVVMDAVHRLQGTVEMESSSPGGSTFLITVPVTISTARILTVRSAGQRYGIPTTSIIRTGRVPPDAVRDIEGALVLTVDDAPVRWVALSTILGDSQSTAATSDESLAYLLLQHEGRRLALSVNEFEDESEVILKSLEFPLAEIDEVVGGTIRPDGSVQLVLDPAWLMFKALDVVRPAVGRPSQTRASVLVVDDSPTTRSILRNVLSAAGYAVQTANDGLDALQRLQSRPFDLVVSDVEMPRMNGFELTRQIKSGFDLPVVLVTGREKEEDRREGLQAGADAYVVKSTFEDKGLLEIVKQFV